MPVHHNDNGHGQKQSGQVASAMQCGCSEELYAGHCPLVSLPQLAVLSLRQMQSTLPFQMVLNAVCA